MASCVQTLMHCPVPWLLLGSTLIFMVWSPYIYMFIFIKKSFLSRYVHAPGPKSQSGNGLLQGQGHGRVDAPGFLGQAQADLGIRAPFDCGVLSKTAILRQKEE